MKVYCINLKRSTERRAKMEVELGKTSLPYEFIDAIDGRAMSDKEIKRVYSNIRTLFRRGLPMTRGEIGCVLSHLLFYDKVLAGEDEIALVLEDDVILYDGAQQAFEKVAEFLSRTKEPTIVEFPGVARDLKVAKGDELVRVRSAQGTYAYAVNKAGAKLLKKAFTPVCMPADFYRYLIRHFGLNYWVYPKMVVSVDMIGESSVGRDRKKFSGWRLCLFRVWRCIGVLLDCILSREEWQ